MSRRGPNRAPAGQNRWVADSLFLDGNPPQYQRELVEETLACPECGADRDLTLTPPAALACPQGHTWEAPAGALPALGA